MGSFKKQTRSVALTLREAGPQALSVARLPGRGVPVPGVRDPRDVPPQAANCFLLMLLCENLSSLEQVENNPKRDQADKTIFSELPD